jgi:lipid-binding SYLF domain-containing protein
MNSSLVRATALAALVLVPALAGCRSAKGDTASEKRAYVLEMRKDALARLHRERPESKAKLASADGYGVFSSLGTKLFVASGNGFGVVRDNASGRDTYMSMAELGVGIGLGVKDTRMVIVFHDPATLRKFTEDGWQWGGDADASAKYEDKGGSASAGAEVMSDMEVYVLTEGGVALQATVTGTKYWKDAELNGP